MKQFKLIIAGVLLFFMAFLTGCTEDRIETEVTDTVSVSLRLDEAFQEKAYVRLTHNGDRSDFWYYMITTDLGTDADLLLNEYIADALEADGELVGNVGTNKNITFEGLDAKTDYRVIASRISPAGEIIGNVAELTFVTLRDPDVFEINPNWSITYKERKIVENPYGETEIFECKVTGNDTVQTYIPCLLTKEDFRLSYGNNLRRCFEDYIAYRNLSNVKWEKVVTADNSEFVQDRLRHGDYVLFMIGVDTTGELTGYYAKTDCTIAQETPTEAFRAWVGNWTITGKYEGINISYDVEISPDENNMYYRMYGWESLTALDFFESLPEQLPIQLYFEKTTGDVYVVSEELPELDTQALAEFYDFYLYGAINYGGNIVNVDVPNLRLARFHLVDSNHATASAEKFTFEADGSVYEEPFIFFSYVYTAAVNNFMTYMPVTTDMKVPRIETLRLERK